MVDASHQTAAISDESDLVFSGFAVFLDPPKASAGATIQAMAAAGIAVKVLTGDNELVTRHVFAEIGVPVTGVLTGDALTHLSDEALIGQLPRVNLFCRVNPQQKLRILLALKRLGHVVGFMGDGINDAPALHAADVGISVDGAADVARAAADLILLEHDLSVVRDAVVCGRSTVQNVSKYVLMGSSSNFGNMFSMAGAALFLPFLPMLPIQILLNNLLYDVSEIAIPFDRVDRRGDRRAGEMGHQVDRTVHAGIRAGQLGVRFSDILCPAVSVRRRRGAVPDRLVHRVDHDPGAGGLRHPDAAVGSFGAGRIVFLVAMALGVIAVAIALPLLPIGGWFGFVAPPPLFFVFLIGATLAYLAIVEVTKRVFYRVMPVSKS